MAEQFGEKSHEATPHRRQQAREQGQIAKSQDLGSAILLIGAVLVIMSLGGSLASFFGRYAQMQLGGSPWLQTDTSTFLAHWKFVVVELGRVLVPIFGIMVIVAILVNLGQVGFLFLPNKLSLDLGRISPAKGMARLFSISNTVRLLFGIIKISIIAVVALASVWAERETIFSLTGMSIPQIATYVGDITLFTCLKIGIVLLILAILDYAFQRWQQEQDLRMTTQEVREEMKQLQGDPQVLARRRTVQRQLVLNRLSSTVPRADVVVTNPTELAIAVQYDPQSMPAPVVIAKGAGVIAQRIRRLALENSVPIVERKDLARTLYKHVEVNQAIPAEQYAAMAEVLKYVYQLKGKTLPDPRRAA